MSMFVAGRNLLSVALGTLSCYVAGCDRENRAVYSSGYTQLFGLPVLVSVPRRNCCHNVLYSCVLAQLV